MSRRPAALVMALLVAVTLTSCVQVPRSGGVTDVRQRTQDATKQQPYYNPPPPRPGALPGEIVSGFLEAMTATPLRSTAASQFLTQQEQAAWRPQQQVITYTGHTAPTGLTDISLRLHHADLIDASGRWRGSVGTSQSRLRFTMARENGEWRIAQAPDAFVLQRGFYQQHYTQDASVYFFDPTGRILVPEPVHVPQGTQLASSLVKALLRGPRGPSRGVERSYIPPNLAVRLSVAVDGSQADVSLTGADPGPLDPVTTRRLLAQLAWTLRQDTTIQTFSLTIAGRQVADATGASRFPVNGVEFGRYDPTYDSATSQIYALRRGRLVSGPAENLTEVQGPFGDTDTGIGAFAVSLRSTRVAGVADDRLLVGSFLRNNTTIKPVLVGSGLLKPAWDSSGRLWEVQRTPAGAQVYVVPPGHQARRVHVPGVSRGDVSRFVVSRDGTRLVAVVRHRGGDSLVVSRIRYDTAGRVIGATRSVGIPWSSPGTTRIRDLAWTSATTLAVLDQVAGPVGEVRILNIDGSSRPDQVPVTTVNGRVRALAAAPNLTPYAVVLPSTLSNISPDQVAQRSIQIDGLRHLTYAG